MVRPLTRVRFIPSSSSIKNRVLIHLSCARNPTPHSWRKNETSSKSRRPYLLQTSTAKLMFKPLVQARIKARRRQSRELKPTWVDLQNSVFHALHLTRVIMSRASNLLGLPLPPQRFPSNHRSLGSMTVTASRQKTCHPHLHSIRRGKKAFVWTNYRKASKQSSKTYPTSKLLLLNCLR